MILKNIWHNAIEQRTSRRTYKNQRIEPQKIEEIKNLIDTINEETGLNIQFVENGNVFLSGFKASYGLISGMPSLIALVGDPGDGIEAARLAPSATNGKPIGYRYRANSLTVFITKKNHGAEEIDLGISMAHFQLGALHGSKEGRWEKEEDGYTFKIDYHN